MSFVAEVWSILAPNLRHEILCKMCFIKCVCRVFSFMKDICYQNDSY